MSHTQKITPEPRENENKPEETAKKVPPERLPEYQEIIASYLRDLKGKP